MATNEEHFRKLERMYQSAPINRYFAPVLRISEGSAQLTIPVKTDFFHAAHAVHGSVYFKALDDAAFLLLGLVSLQARAGEPPAAPILRIETGRHTAAIRRIAVDRAGRLLVTASDDKTLRLWELPSGRLLKVLRPPIGEGNEGKLY